MNLPQGLNLEVSMPCEEWGISLPDYEDIIIDSVSVISLYIPEGQKLSNFSYIDLSVVLCDDEYIQTLNDSFRDQNKPTNVLSFEGLDAADLNDYLREGSTVPDRPYSLGEVYVAFETMLKEAHEADIPLKNHFYHLIIHGILHLLGYDHIEDNEAVIMENHESFLLEKLGVDDPYAA